MFQCESNTMQNNIKSKFIWIFHAHAVKLSDIFHSIWVYMVGCCNLLQSIYEEGESKKKNLLRVTNEQRFVDLFYAIKTIQNPLIKYVFLTQRKTKYFSVWAKEKRRKYSLKNNPYSEIGFLNGK